MKTPEEYNKIRTTTEEEKELIKKTLSNARFNLVKRCSSCCKENAIDSNSGLCSDCLKEVKEIKG